MNAVATQQQGRAGNQLARADEFKQEIVLARPTIQKMLPVGTTVDKFEGMVISVVSNNAKLLECSQRSLIKAVIDAADAGLSLNPIMREADILPVWTPNGSVAQFRPRAIGFMKLARQSGDVVKIDAHEVYEGDDFDYTYGMDATLTHKPMSVKRVAAGEDRGIIIAGYCIWQLKDGTKQFEVIDRKRIERSRAASEGYKYAISKNQTNSVWHLHEAEMVRKTAVRAAAKYFPMSTENSALLRAMHNEDEIEGEFTVAHDGAGTEGAGEAQERPSGAEQVKGLEARLGVAEQPQQDHKGSTEKTEEAPAKKAETKPKKTAPAKEQFPEPPPPASEDDYGNIPVGLDRRDKKPAKADAATQDAEVKAELPADDSDEWGDEAKPVDWKATAHAMRKEMISTGNDGEAFTKWVKSTKSMRDRMKAESPDWYTKLQKEIVAKETYLRERA